MGGSSTVTQLNQTAAQCLDTDCGQLGVYGTLGIPAAGNVPGGRGWGASWIDGSGNFWLFGGEGLDSVQLGVASPLGDMWMYNPASNEWAWKGGSNNSGGTGALGPPGVYGTLGTPAAGNIPGDRWNASSATDGSGNFWLFGGDGFDSVGRAGLLNDLFEFNPSTGQWTWISGNNVVGQVSNGYTYGQPGVYGTLGVPAAANVPGGRHGQTSWTDGNGNFWLFGGYGAVPNYFGLLNDLWKFNSSSREWTWMGGSNTVNPNCPRVDGIYNCQAGQPGVYGGLGVPSASNVPGGRWLAAAWTDSGNNLWLFGGQGLDANYDLGYLNDFWELDTSASPVQWTWVGGSSTIPAACAAKEATEGDTDLGILTCGQPGEYGKLGTPEALNIPGGRFDSPSTWADKSGNLWLFGGYGFDLGGTWGYLNDLWVFQPTVGTLPAFAPTFSPASGIYAAGQTATISDAAPGASIYYTVDGSTPSTSSLVFNNPIIISSTETVQAIAAAENYSNSAVASAEYTIAQQVHTPTFSLPVGTYTNIQTVTISDTSGGATIYYTLDGTVPTTSSPIYNSAITVSSTETINAIAAAPGYATSAVASATYTIPPDFSIAISPTSMTVSAGSTGSTDINVTAWGGINSAISFACSGLPTGATCTFSPATVSPTSNSAVTTVLSVAVPVSSAALYRSGNNLITVASLVGMLCCIRRRKLLRLILFTLLVGCAGFEIISGCGGGPAPSGGPPPASYSVTVTATSGSLQHTAALTMTVSTPK